MPHYKVERGVKNRENLQHLRKAVEVATAEQPGPVHLDFPEDVADASSDENQRVFIRPRLFFPVRSEGSQESRSAHSKIQVPLAAVGLTMNRADATRELRALIDKHRLPVVCTFDGESQVAEEGSSFVGVVGRAKREMVAEYYKPADLIIAIGMIPLSSITKSGCERTSPSSTSIRLLPTGLWPLRPCDVVEIS